MITQSNNPLLGKAHWLNCEFRALGAIPTQPRIHRRLEEALTHGPDPSHLVAVFGIAESRGALDV